MNKSPQKNNKKSSFLLSTWSGIKSFSKSLSREVIVNYLATVFEKFVQLIRNNIPSVITAIVSIAVSIYVVIIRFTGQTFTITGGQILGGLGFAFLFLVAIICGRMIRRRYIAKRDEFIKIFDLDWKLKENNLTGPYCPHCNKDIISEEMLMESIGQALDGMFGEQVNYTYSCANCRKQITLYAPLEQMKVDAYKRAIGNALEPQ